MNDKTSVKKDFFWKAAVSVLIILLIVQTAVTTMLLYNRKSVPVQSRRKQVPDLQLKPRVNVRNAQNQQPSSSSKTSGLPNIRRLPKQRLNLNGTCSSQPSSPGGNLFPGNFPSMSINISPDPFFSGNTIRADIARMEKMMSMMMNMRFPQPSMHIPRNSFQWRNTTPPALKLSADKKCYIVTMKIPGLDKSEINARLDGDMLTISGVKREKSTFSGRGGSSSMTSYSSFQNSFLLPGHGNPDKMKIDYKNDILTVKIPKT